jgi:hypothetical protein
MARIEQSGLRGFGLDRDANPPWLMVSALPANSFYSEKAVFLVDGAGWTLSSSKESVATIVADNSFGLPDVYLITGVRRGIAHILGEPPGGSGIWGPVQLLEVEVKDERPLKLAFNFVSDSHFEKTTRSAIAFELRRRTNKIFQGQANVTVDRPRNKDIQVRTSLRDIIGRQNRSELAFSGELRGPYHELFKLTDEGDRDADINVFFMPRSILARENVNPPLVFGGNGVIVIEDDRGGSIERVERDLAHWIAFLLGCDRTNDRKKADHLMLRSSDVTARFIPKEYANLLNPTF